MATVNVRQSKLGTTIRVKAGKGEDLRGLIEAMFGLAAPLPSADNQKSPSASADDLGGNP